jgi:hypothetical protein
VGAGVIFDFYMLIVSWEFFSSWLVGQRKLMWSLIVACGLIPFLLLVFSLCCGCFLLIADLLFALCVVAEGLGL